MMMMMNISNDEDNGNHQEIMNDEIIGNHDSIRMIIKIILEDDH